jgi:hypothetical protein
MAELLRALFGVLSYIFTTTYVAGGESVRHTATVPRQLAE